MTHEQTPTFEYLLVPPKGWTDIGSPRIFYRELKSGPQYLGRFCGEINHTRSPVYHRPGCPRLASFDDLCPVCNGNDGDVPCAYPGEGMTGCPREYRLVKERR